MRKVIQPPPPAKPPPVSVSESALCKMPGRRLRKSARTQPPHSGTSPGLAQSGKPPPEYAKRKITQGRTPHACVGHTQREKRRTASLSPAPAHRIDLTHRTASMPLQPLAPAKPVQCMGRLARCIFAACTQGCGKRLSTYTELARRKCSNVGVTA